jgi:hypothetical protein
MRLLSCILVVTPLLIPTALHAGNENMGGLLPAQVGALEKIEVLKPQSTQPLSYVANVASSSSEKPKMIKKIEIFKPQSTVASPSGAPVMPK